MNNLYKKLENHKVLIVDDEPDILELLTSILTSNNFTPLTALSSSEALALLKNHYPLHTAIIDYMLPDMNGIELISHIKQLHPFAEIIAMTAVGTRENVANLIKAGASFYLDKERLSDENTLITFLEECIKTSIKNQRVEHIRQELTFSTSPNFREILKLVEQWSKYDVPILITGESGTGKELIARLIHKLSYRNHGPFIPINCGGLTENLIESELFGYAPGSFTDALKKGKPGKLQQANHGTLFLDEIADLPPKAQTTILRFLQDMTITPVGSNESKKVDTRFLCASNKDLKALINSGMFREDLFHRFGKFTIELPPLRERKQDIPLLVKDFIEDFSLEHNIEQKTLSPDVLDILIYYHWQGNVRELENTIEYCLINAKENESTTINPEHLPKDVREDGKNAIPKNPTNTISPVITDQQPKPHNEIIIKINIDESLYLSECLEKIEKEIIEKFLAKNNWNVSATAKQLKLPKESSLRNKMKRLQIRQK